MDESLKEFGKTLRTLRTSLKKSLRRAEIDLLSFLGDKSRGCDHTTIAKDEKGKSLDIPFYRIKGYSHIYGVITEQLFAEYIAARHGVDYTKKIEVQAGQPEDLAPPGQKRIYKLLRSLLDTKDQEEMFAYLKILNQGALSKEGKPVTPEERAKSGIQAFFLEPEEQEALTMLNSLKETKSYIDILIKGVQEKLERKAFKPEERAEDEGVA